MASLPPLGAKNSTCFLTALCGMRWIFDGNETQPSHTDQKARPAAISQETDPSLRIVSFVSRNNAVAPVAACGRPCLPPASIFAFKTSAVARIKAAIEGELRLRSSLKVTCETPPVLWSSSVSSITATPLSAQRARKALEAEVELEGGLPVRRLR